jgi:membrane carboxypeptidase/penicillin-binding protein
LIRKLALALAAALILYVAYLGWRIAGERRDVAARVDAIIAKADADELALSSNRIQILLRVEDPTFRSNKGIDLSTPGAGMTTLSQSLGKRIFFDDFEPGFAKGELMTLTRFALYPKVSKDKTLKAWLATTYLGTYRGRRVTGFADGARTWLGKPLRDLGDREYLMLVAMLPAPDSLKPTRDMAALDDRVRRIERLLAGQCMPTGLRDVMLEGCRR